MRIGICNVDAAPWNHSNVSSSRIDTDNDRRISKAEFTSDKIKPVIEKWVGKIDDWDEG